jgi:hypothetical protein
MTLFQAGRRPRLSPSTPYAVRYLAMPELFASGLRYATCAPELTAHEFTGRPAGLDRPVGRVLRSAGYWPWTGGRPSPTVPRA